METEVSEGPKQITAENVQYWSIHAKALKHSQVHKASIFTEQDLIRYVGDDPEFNSKYTFICLPLNTKDHTEVTGTSGGTRTFNKNQYMCDYNWNAYKIYKNTEGLWECSCQGWNTRYKRGELQEDGVMCSHVLALFFCFRLKRFGRHY